MDSKVRTSLRTDRLRATREKLGLTQQELARLCGIGMSQIPRYELGLTEPSGSILAIIASQLGVTMDYLYGLTEVAHNYPSLELRQDERHLLDAYTAGDAAMLMKLAVERLKQIEAENQADE